MIDRIFIDPDNRLKAFFAVVAMVKSGTPGFPHAGTQDELLRLYLPYTVPVGLSHFSIPYAWFKENTQGAWFETKATEEEYGLGTKIVLLFELEDDATLYRLTFS